MISAQVDCFIYNSRWWFSIPTTLVVPVVGSLFCWVSCAGDRHKYAVLCCSEIRQDNIHRIASCIGTEIIVLKLFLEPLLI